MSVNASEQTQVPPGVVLLLVQLKNRSVRLTNKQNKKWQSQKPMSSTYYKWILLPSALSLHSRVSGVLRKEANYNYFLVHLNASVAWTVWDGTRNDIRDWRRTATTTTETSISRKELLNQERPNQVCFAVCFPCVIKPCIYHRQGDIFTDSSTVIISLAVPTGLGCAVEHSPDWPKTYISSEWCQFRSPQWCVSIFYRSTFCCRKHPTSNINILRVFTSCRKQPTSNINILLVFTSPQI